MKRINYIIPFLILFILLGFLGRELFYAKPNELPSTLIGEALPDFKLQNLYNTANFFTPASINRKQVTLINIWATWCYACSLEQSMLMKIKNTYHVPIYGLDYKDDDQDAKTWLEKNGNPYVLIGADKKGDTAIDLGVYGTPETFVISKQGTIVYRHIGVITQKDWDTVLYPLIRKYNEDK